MHKKSTIVRLPFTTLTDKDKKDVLNIPSPNTFFCKQGFCHLVTILF